ncbi:hypothetical protein BT93_L0751 [Corymbia citriodora subsp. variegata]|uniref:NB-ARC domain-containing protein n=1 Tax=Corymbia citriodora subsp. variegata TaxID=360336 RepID=A0A8T0CT58_CORYI|nr:hypothetical protein BT93_L0751 [Corymbia citriodora subsp. variegata]
MSADSVVTVIWDVLKCCVVVPIKRGFGYVIFSKRFTNRLRGEVQNLEEEVQRVEVLVGQARNNVRKFYDVFTTWKASADKALEEARELLDDFEKATKTCCYGTLPDPKSRYQFSRKAEGKIEFIKQLAQTCSSRFNGFDDISFIDTALGNVGSPNPARREGKYVVQSIAAMASTSSALTSIKLGDDGVFESRALIMQGIMDALADNSNSVVGVYGMGGVGKSTLLVDVERRIRKEQLFDLVAKANVSENPDIKTIQGEIADALDLIDIKNKETISGRAKLLHERLMEEEGKKKKVLIILDNLWKALDLKSVGIPCRYDNKVIGCKLLLTSRYQNVLQSEMGCDKDFLLNSLEEKEAKILFENMVQDKVHDVQFRPLVAEALRKCAGLPLLIITMANHFKYADLSGWRDALCQIEWCTNEGISAVINEMLRLSYDHLESKDAKSLLQLCVACGVSELSIENLVRYGYGLGIFRKDCSMKESRDRLSTLIQTLQASSLLLDNGGATDVKIHDLVRDFVARFICRDHTLLVLNDKDMLATQLRKERLKSCTAICFPFIDMKELPKELDCPELRIFLLSTNKESLEVPDSYFNSMRKLAVLNLTRVCLTRSLMPFQFMENLHTLCLQSCSLEDVAILGKLKGLQILSFVNSKIQRLPKEIGQLEELRLLDLTSCSNLQIIEPGVLGRLINLEELYMENSFNQWNPVEQTQPTNASLIELTLMKNLCILHVSILDSSVLPWDLNIEKLTKYKIQLGHLGLDFWRWSSKYKGLRVLELNLNPTSDILQRGCIRTTLDIIDDLWMGGLNGIEQSICQLSLEGFPQLKRLHVQNSPSVHYILKRSSFPAFNSLELLFLESLINLEKLCHDDISSKSFRALKVVRVQCCHKLEVLFPLSLLRELPQLEEIEIADCKLMQGIVKADDCGKVELRNLHVLKLHDLPDMKNFFTAGAAPVSRTSNDQVSAQIAFFNGQQVSVPSLKSLTMIGLPNMKEIWSNESPLELSNLQTLEVAQCKSLLKVISSRSLIKLHKLHNLCIRDCNSVQEIFDLNEPSTNGNVDTLSEVTTLKLVRLGSLRCIWNKNPCGIMGFHNLNKLEVDHCDNLRFLFFPSMIKSLSQLRDLTVQIERNI